MCYLDVCAVVVPLRLNCFELSKITHKVHKRNDPKIGLAQRQLQVIPVSSSSGLDFPFVSKTERFHIGNKHKGHVRDEPYPVWRGLISCDVSVKQNTLSPDPV
jgi:hypothetical protein